ncbi:alkaline phosphatase PafA [Spongiimicrobium salis]|uniref:alkaline phosphatase PafA n=1 Tax=Spongiimicrobium salis TaxID=1667022 RepID=UPI00374CE5E4
MHQKKNFLLILVLFILHWPTEVAAQKRARKKSNKTLVVNQSSAQTPKLVVGIVVDQMRFDYLTRFWKHYGNGGFKRLVNGGFNCKNNHFNYAPTSTGPGHTSVYTGTTPATHGIIGNTWYDKDLDKEVYCASDEAYESIGTTSNAGKMSPHRMGVTTLTDQLRLHTQMKGKVIAIALKDRGAVLPGGHTANAAYWFHGQDEGKWISSSFYMKKLPRWVEDFNAARSVDQYKKAWTTLKDIALYEESGSDNNSYEGKFNGETTTAFPHDLPSLWNTNGAYDMLKATAFGNTITADFALTALKEEQLGVDAIPDFLAVSFSSTDYVGHKYGVNSKEIQDTYLRLDQDLERLFNALDAQVGQGEYTVFLTADHGAVQVPQYLRDQKIPAGYMDYNEMRKELEEFLKYTYGTTDIVKNFSNNQIFLDHKIIHNLDLDVEKVQENIAKEFLRYKDVYRVYTAQQMWKNHYTKGIPYVLQNGYHQKRSGDVLIVLNHGTSNYSRTGSTHGTSQIYDTHVPLLFYGKGITQGSTVNRTEIPDIAPTIASLLGIAFPNGTTGKPITEVLK